MIVYIKSNIFFGKAMIICCFIFNQNNLTYIFTKLSHPRVPAPDFP